MAKGFALSTGYLPLGGLPRNSVDRITDRPDMTQLLTVDVKHQPKQTVKTVVFNEDQVVHLVKSCPLDTSNTKIAMIHDVSISCCSLK